VSAIITENMQVSYRARWKLGHSSDGDAYDSLDASGGSVFRIIIGPAMLD
jgi:hypothetical protein